MMTTNNETEFQDTRAALDPRKLVEALRELYDAAARAAECGAIDPDAYVYAGRTLRDADAALKDGAR